MSVQEEPNIIDCKYKLEELIEPCGEFIVTLDNIPSIDEFVRIYKYGGYIYLEGEILLAEKLLDMTVKDCIDILNKEPRYSFHVKYDDVILQSSLSSSDYSTRKVIVTNLVDKKTKEVLIRIVNHIEDEE